MDLPILTAVISVSGTLFGTIVGGCLTMYSNFFLNRRREQADFRIGCRLVAGELELNTVYVGAVLKYKRWWVTETDLMTEAWEEHRHALASHLSDENWRDVLSAAQAVHHGQLVWAQARDAQKVRGAKAEKMDDGDIQMMTKLAADITRGQTSLQRYLTKPRRRLLEPLRVWRRITRPPISG
jgi:hypothetical protein